MDAASASSTTARVHHPALHKPGIDFIDRAIAAVCAFSEFTEDNDPHGEHDFGAFEIDGVRLNWKIDYYDRALAGRSPNPADPAVTRRVLTILLAEKY
jgi:hypothetical protein